MSQSFITYVHSSAFLVCLKRAMVINWGSRDQNEKMQQPLLDLNKDFLKTGGVTLNTTAELEPFTKVVLELKKYSLDTPEKLKREGIAVTRDYLKVFFE